MIQKGRVTKSIPSVLSIPEKLNGFLLRVLKLRLPLERRFSMRDLLFVLGAFLLFVLKTLVPMSGTLQTVFTILVLMLALIPVLLQGLRLVLRRVFPWEEATVLAAKPGSAQA